MRVLIVTKDPEIKGGVSNFYRIFLKKYRYEDIEPEVLIQGLSSPQRRYQLPLYLLKYVKDVLVFTKRLVVGKDIRIVHLNPSLYPLPLMRDSYYVLLSSLLRRKVLVFFHGWDPAYYDRLSRSSYLGLFKRVYSRADAIFVLARDFKESLEKIGFSNVKLAKTFFDGDRYVGIEKTLNEMTQITYMGRMEKEKGIFLILDALRSLKKEKVPFRMAFAGWFVDEGVEKSFNDKLKGYDLGSDVEFLGYITDKEKIERLHGTDIFVYPSYYPEGCPTVVIEALAAGCFVISSDVAALKEVIIEGINGHIINDRDHADLADRLKGAILERRFPERAVAIREDAYEKYESRVIVDLVHSEYRKMVE